MSSCEALASDCLFDLLVCFWYIGMTSKTYMYVWHVDWVAIRFELSAPSDSAKVDKVENFANLSRETAAG